MYKEFPSERRREGKIDQKPVAMVMQKSFSPFRDNFSRLILVLQLVGNRRLPFDYFPLWSTYTLVQLSLPPLPSTGGNDSLTSNSFHRGETRFFFTSLKISLHDSKLWFKRENEMKSIILNIFVSSYLLSWKTDAFYLNSIIIYY